MKLIAMKLLAPISLVLLGVAHADFFRNEFTPIGHVRTDAIIVPDCLSAHVHTFYGPPLLYPNVSFADLRNSDPKKNSGNIEENPSLYWHPTVYQVASNGVKTLMESNMTTVYYNWFPGQQAKAFPPGFRMITPGEEVFSAGITPGASEMELSISFQSCWDGVNVDSPDHMSHVAFPTGEDENSVCPNTHPVRLPRLDFFIRFVNTQSAQWQFSDGTRTFHADYISGWDEAKLQAILDGGDGNFESQVTFRDGVKHDGDDAALIQLHKEKGVPQADTSCITTEVIDKVVDLPAFSCTGTLISPNGVCPSGPSTNSPTNNPTITPASTTKAPTNNPTISKAPTNSPTNNPTITPASTTKAPTNNPTISKAPTNSPTNNPTTKAPTTKAPTNNPTISKAPTNNPTATPTVEVEPEDEDLRSAGFKEQISSYIVLSCLIISFVF